MIKRVALSALSYLKVSWSYVAAVRQEANRVACIKVSETSYDCMYFQIYDVRVGGLLSVFD